MVKSEIVNYIKKHLNEGYDIKIIRDWLIHHGYSQKDVDDAVDSIYAIQTKSPASKKEDNPVEHRHLSKKSLISIVVTVLILFLVVIAITLIVRLGNINQPVGEDVEEPITPPPEEPLVTEFKFTPSGVTECINVSDSERINCYYKFFEMSGLDACEEIEDREEKNFCYSTKEFYLLKEI